MRTRRILHLVLSESIYKSALALVVLVGSLPLLAQQDPDQLAQQGQQALAAGRFDAAETSFVQLAKLEPSVAEVHATLGAVYFQQGKFSLAIESLHRALSLKPSLSRAKTLLAICLEESGQSAEAVPGLEYGFRSSDDPEIRRHCGLELLRAYSALHRDADAVQTSLALNKLYPDDPEVLYQTARIYGNFAFVTMQALKQKAPDSIWMAQARAESNESQKSYEAAIAAYQQVLAMDPRRPGIHYRLGRIYLSRFEDAHRPDDREAARNEFTAELSLDPSNANAGYELAQIYVDTGNLDEAGKQFQQVLARFPDFEQALVGLGRVYFQSDQAAQAIPPLQHATQLNAQDEIAWYRLAQAERATGDREAAHHALETFRKLHAAAGDQPKLQSADEITPQQLAPNEPATLPDN